MKAMTKWVSVVWMATALLALGQQVILNESWSNGERTAQNLPESARWFASGPADTVKTEPGAMVLDLSETRQVAAYFADEGGVKLEPGQTLSMIYSFSFSGQREGAGGFLRVGLFNTDTRPRVTRDNAGTNNHSFIDSTGYSVWLTRQYSTSSGFGESLRSRFHSGGILLSFGGAHIRLGEMGDSEQALIRPGQTYHGLLAVTLNEPGRATVRAELKDAEGATLYAIEREATPAVGGVVSAFDMVGFTASAQCGDQLKIESVLIEKR